MDSDGSAGCAGRSLDESTQSSRACGTAWSVAPGFVRSQVRVAFVSDIAPSAGLRCHVCTAQSVAFGSARVLERFDVQYFQCSRCRFVQTEHPYWLAEAYSTALIAADVGAVDRNLRLAGITQTLIQQFFDANGTFLDYGGGYGLFVRLMRDRGFDFRWHDRYAKNLLSMGFDAAANASSFDLVTAFEVLEHLVNPLEEIDAMFARSNGSVLCSTMLLPENNPRPGAWWYYVPTGGQHVSIYSRESLHQIAARLGCQVVSDGAGLHLFTRRSIPQSAFRLVARQTVSSLLNRLRRRPSLVPQDFERVTGRTLG
jgi:hypothetical protein